MQITPQDAIENLKELEAQLRMDDVLQRRDTDTFEVAIEALQFKQNLVRCKDCASALPLNDELLYCWVYSYEDWKMVVTDDGYCHLGVRRNEE